MATTKKGRTTKRVTKTAKARVRKKTASAPGKRAASGARKGKAAPKQPRRPPKVDAPGDDSDSLPRFTVAFIDSAGGEHAATALAPDPGVALSGLLEKAAELDEPWLDDLVAVVVSHPTTWASVRDGVLEQFER